MCLLCVVDVYKPGPEFTFIIEFRTYDCNGILLYNAHPTFSDHVAVELKSGLVSPLASSTRATTQIYGLQNTVNLFSYNITYACNNFRSVLLLIMAVEKLQSLTHHLTMTLSVTETGTPSLLLSQGSRFPWWWTIVSLWMSSFPTRCT